MASGGAWQSETFDDGLIRPAQAPVAMQQPVAAAPPPIYNPPAQTLIGAFIQARYEGSGTLGTSKLVSGLPESDSKAAKGATGAPYSRHTVVAELRSSLPGQLRDEKNVVPHTRAIPGQPRRSRPNPIRSSLLSHSLVLHSRLFENKPVQHSLSKLTRLAAPRRSRSVAVTCSSVGVDDEKSRVGCSRREVLGLGSLLAVAFSNLVVSAPEAADAGQATCGEFNVTASGLAYCDSQVGSGIAATKGMLIKAHYSGRLESGNKFDSSYSRGKPLTFRVGVGEVIRGWDQGILGTEGISAMQAGGKRTLRIPANLGYGERGAGCKLGSCLIPPNSTLVFDV